MAQQAAGAEARPSGWERAVRKFSAAFEQLGLTAADIPAAIVVHEVLGLVMAIGWWGLCYAVVPSKRLATTMAGIAKGQRGAQLQKVYNAAMAQATARVRQLSWLRGDPARLTVSLAESMMLRGAIKPLTLPFKIWASYEILIAGKWLTAGVQQRKAGGQQPLEQTSKRG